MNIKIWTFTRNILGAIAAVAIVVGSAHVASAQPFTVVVNGQVVQFNNPPVERSGRVFVPLRSVFDQLGASVVYDNGEINATRGGTTVQLHLGSTSALVNGNSEQLEIAPFEIGSVTYIPLRFVSQALGANVDWNDNTNTITIDSQGSNGYSTVALTNLHPRPGAVVRSNQPAVSGSFSTPVNPDTIRITLDGRDVSSTTDISSDAFMFTPPYGLIAGVHTVRVRGQTQGGSPFRQSWSFTTGEGAQSNFINNLVPPSGTAVGDSFTISGTTLPGSSVHIVVAPVAVIDGMFSVAQGTFVTTVQADNDGNFSQPVNIAATNGGTVHVRIISTAPDTGASDTADLTLHS